MYLAFELDGGRYAIPAGQVRELVRAVRLSSLPGAPPVIEGVFNLRGRIVPVLNVRARFGLPARPVTPSDHLIIASAGARLIALRVDRAMDLMALADDDVQPAGELTGTAPMVTGAARLPDGLILIYDVERFLTSAEQASMDEAIGRDSGQGVP